MRRTRAASVAAVAAAATLLLAACGGGGGSTGGQGGGGGESSGSSTSTGIFKGCADPLTCNAASPDQLQQGGQGTCAIEKKIDDWTLTSSAGNVFETGVALKPILPYAYVTTPDLKS